MFEHPTASAIVKSSLPAYHLQLNRRVGDLEDHILAAETIHPVDNVHVDHLEPPQDNHNVAENIGNAGG
ncbi:unnamed protein product [Linum trigynum]|uniref:Uncharacterized protein n=1 Tax=Linum trigynum TaxID=586398 RepID=A0AAV2CRA5_9ROSI